MLGLNGVLLEHLERARQRTDLVATLGADDHDIKIALGELRHQTRHRRQGTGNATANQPGKDADDADHRKDDPTDHLRGARGNRLGSSFLLRALSGG
jgi:hypothetical protein